MHSRDHAIECHEVMRRHKEHVWYEHQNNDMPPQLTVRWRDMEPQGINIALQMAKLGQQISKYPISDEQKRELGRPARILWGLFQLMTEEGTYPPEVTPPPNKDHPIETIMLALEGYQATAAEVPEGATEEEIQALADDVRGRIAPGDLEREYQTNPGSGIHETLITYIIETGPLGTPEWSRVTSGVRKGDGGRLVWDEPIVHTSEDPTNYGEHDLLLTVLSRYVRRENLT